jgi:hypothetical protein
LGTLYYGIKANGFADHSCKSQNRFDLKELEHRIGLVPLFVGVGYCNGLFLIVWLEMNGVAYSALQAFDLASYSNARWL